MLQQSTLLIVAHGKDREVLKATISANVSTQCTYRTHLIAIDPEKISANQRAEIQGIVEHKLSQIWPDGTCCILIEKQVLVSDAGIRKWCERENRGPFQLRRLPLLNLKQGIVKHLIDLQMHWRPAVEQEVAFHTNHEDGIKFWLEQFEFLGVGWLGSEIAKRICVVNPTEFEAAYRNIGYAGALLSVGSDADSGSSSFRIAGVLERHSGKPIVFEHAIQISADHNQTIIHCEDGLWTGTEARRLLDKLRSTGSHGAYVNQPVVFRHFCQTDYGLLTCRQYCEYHGFKNVHFECASGRSPIRILQTSCDESKWLQQFSDKPEEFQNYLVQYVEPQIVGQLRESELDIEEATIFLNEVGRQLSDPYLERVFPNGRYKEEIKQQWAFGGRKLGLTTLFSHSIPRSCSPLLWLGGRVEFKGKSQYWRPLFKDRRYFGGIFAAS